MMKQYRGQRRGCCGASLPGSYNKANSALDRGAERATVPLGNNTVSGGQSNGPLFGCVSAGSYRDFPLAMVFPPAQSYGNLYSPMEGLENGTLFADLKMPFHGKFKI